MSNIILKSKEAAQKFQKGEAVFRIVFSTGGTLTEDRGIATTLSDFEKLLSKHEYISLIHLAPLVYKIAYVYGCLNFEKGTPRKETFTFLFREIGKHEWKEWFVVQPYTD
jgi:hypothetical protein